MLPSHLILKSLPQGGDSQIVRASSLSLELPQPPKRFFRHGWQSWALTTWLDPDDSPAPIRAAEFRIKDEDPGYALHKNHVSAWVAAVELGEDDLLLLGALDLGGRVELERTTLNGFYESAEPVLRPGHRPSMQGSVPPGEWFIAHGQEYEVFSSYVEQLKTKFGHGRFQKAPRVWCSWYSLYRWVNERVILRVLKEFGDIPFDVFQVDDGWQQAYGDWESNKRFPSGMKSLAKRISASSRTPGIWLAPFMVSSNSQLAKVHPDWFLLDKNGKPVPVGITWSRDPLGLDMSHPEVLAWLDLLIRKVRGWGYGYLKLDFLYIGALIGKRYKDVPREVAYRNALQVIREAAGDAYILACGAPIIPSLGLCDGMRVGPDVAPYWLNKPLSVWLNNPNETSTQNAVRTAIHRLWLSPIVNVDPDVAFFRTKYNRLTPQDKGLLQDLARISGFEATSDLPQWLNVTERKALREFLESDPTIQKRNRYEYQIDQHYADFSPAIPIPQSENDVPVWLAKFKGLLKIGFNQALPAIWASKKFG